MVKLHSTTARGLIVIAVLISALGVLAAPSAHPALAINPARIIDSSDLGLAPTEAMIDQMDQKHIRFHHRSVGNNTLFGLAQIVINGKQVLVDEEMFPDGAEADQKVDVWKNEVIARNTNADPNDNIDVAVFKWCYVDSWNASVDRLKTAIAEINSQTAVKILVFTMPVTHLPNDDITNINLLVRPLPDQYSNVWVYDIADVESTHADGTVCSQSGARILCPEYTDDGDHPGTEAGYTRVGKGFFVALYEITRDGSAQPALSLAKNVAGPHNPAWPGDVMTYTIVVRNTGSADAASVHITDTLPNYIVGSNIDVVRTVTASNAITLDVPVTLSTGVPWGTIITNTAYYEHSSSSGSAAAGTTVTSSPVVSFTKSVSLTASNQPLGKPVTYTIVLSNSSAIPVNGMVLTDDLPTAVSFGGWIQTNGAIQNNGAITWTGNLSASTRLTFVFSGTLAADLGLYGQTITNTAHYRSAAGQAGAANAAFPVRGADLSGSSKAVSGYLVSAGSLVTYTIKLVNSGSLSSTVRYTDTLPDEVEWVSGSLTGAATVNPGQLVQITVVTRVKTGLPDYAPFHNSVLINDGYRPVFSRNSPETSIVLSYIYLPLVWQ
jgi:uncharacterized repeat protein (TIGR01451 family)